MKKIGKWIAALLSVALMLALPACKPPQPSAPNGDEPDPPGIVTPPDGDKDPDTDKDPDDGKPTYCRVLPVSYSEVEAQADMVAFFNQTKQANGASHDGRLDYGFVDSVWHTLRVGGVDVPVYSARCGTNVHSFAWVDVDTDGDLALDVELTLTTADKARVVVLPEKSGVQATYAGGKVKAKLTAYGSYSFAFDESADKAVTLYVAPKTAVDVPQGWKRQTVEPGKYTREQTEFTQTKTVYVFKKGVYDITSISIPTESTVYFESGVSLRIYEQPVGDKPDYFAAVRASNVKNVKIVGRALLDFSKCMGGMEKTKGVYDFYNATDMQVEGLISVNSNSWTMCFTDCENVRVSRCMFFSYRTFSDGIMLSDCRDSGATDCFVRTGDDAIEVKSTSSRNGAMTRNIVYENNCVWTDKGIGYGAIYEAAHDMDGVLFRNNSIGFAQAAWSEHLGCCTVQMGSNRDATWENIVFENIEIYKTNCAAMSVYDKAATASEGGTIRNVYFKNIVVKFAEQSNLPVYALRVTVRLGGGADGDNCSVRNLYIDGVDYQGTAVTAANYKTYSQIAVDEGATFSDRYIRVNTDPDRGESA